MIERGRWLKVTKENRLCLECHVLEDEYHAICVCSRYTGLRNKFIKPYYIEKPSMFKFIQLINSDTVTEIKVSLVYKIAF